ncbi:MAG: 50S ribosomal protein L13 [Clostridia bacterium]|nr:50S ribosomal protein L13 [Clostridia bacterium]MDQ7792086.1 50S ribosomal protein L13 [Clostridia bacterium]
MNTTFMARKEDVEHKWYILDAAGKPLGRLATEAAVILRGKHRPTFTPHVDTGDNVIIINAEKVVLTGNKLDQKIYYRHSGYPGGLKEMTYRQLMAKKPEEAVRKAVVGMLPQTKLGAAIAKKLKVYSGADHPHEAQKPELWDK